MRDVYLLTVRVVAGLLFALAMVAGWTFALGLLRQSSNLAVAAGVALIGVGAGLVLALARVALRLMTGGTR